MSKILILGSNGMLGHVVATYFKEQGNDIYTTSRDKQNPYFFDANKDIKGIAKIIDDIHPNIVINCIGILNQVAEENHDLAVLVNSYLPHYLDKLSNQYSFKLVHVSTDCVFSGKMGEYTETSMRDAETFYGQSKALGEVVNNRNLTLRTSIIGPDPNPKGIGLFQWFINQEDEVFGYDQAIWTGITTIELAKAMKTALDQDLSGLHHVVNNQKINKYSLLQLFSEVFDKNIQIIPNSDYVSDKSLVRTANSFDFQVPSYQDMIKDMKVWIEEHPAIYQKEQDK